MPVECNVRVDELERRPLEPRGDVALERLDGASLDGRVERPSRRRVDKNDGLLCLSTRFGSTRAMSRSSSQPSASAFRVSSAPPTLSSSR